MGEFQGPFTANGPVVGGFYGADGYLVGTVRGDDTEAALIARRVADALNREYPLSEDNNHAIDNARAWLSNIRKMVERLGAAEESGDDEAIEKARTEIQEAPLSVMVRDGWHSPGQAHDRVGEPVEYEVLLSTGGPALRIYGQLDGEQPDDDPHLQWQDWGTPWTNLPLDGPEREAVTSFAAQFYFGEG
jgi:hypothetical protein